FVPFGAENMQATESHDFVVFSLALASEIVVDRLPLILRDLKDFALMLEEDHGNVCHSYSGGIGVFRFCADDRGSLGVRHGQAIFEKMLARHEFRIAAQENVGTAAGHVGGDGDGAFAAGLSHDAGFAFVLLCVQDLMRNAGFFENVGDGFGFLDGDGADENGLAAIMIVLDAVGERVVFLQDAVDDGLELFFFGAIDDVGIFNSNERAVGGNDHDVELINFFEFGGFGFRCTGHAGKFLVHPEVVLEGDRGEGLVFALNLHAFLGFNRLMQTIGPAAAGHLSSGEFIHDDDFAVFVDVVDVVFIKRVRAQRLVDVMDDFHVRGIVKVAKTQQAFGLADAFFGQRRSAVLFVDGVVNVLDQLGDDLAHAVVLVRGFFGRTGNDQRGAGFVDQNRVDFVHDGELMAALNTVRDVVLHVVAEIVEAVLVVGAVGDIRTIGSAALVVVQIVDDNADREAEATIEWTHPFRVAASEIVVDGDDVNATTGQRIQDGGKCGDESLSFTGFHF